MTSASNDNQQSTNGTDQSGANLAPWGTAIAILAAILGPILVWQTSTSSFLDWFEQSRNLGPATLEPQELRELLYSAVATLGLGLVAALQIIASPQKRRIWGSATGLVVVGIFFWFFYQQLGGTFPALTLLGLTLPLLGTIVQDLMSGK